MRTTLKSHQVASSLRLRLLDGGRPIVIITTRIIAAALAFDREVDIVIAVQINSCVGWAFVASLRGALALAHVIVLSHTH